MVQYKNCYSVLTTELGGGIGKGEGGGWELQGKEAVSSTSALQSSAGMLVQNGERLGTLILMSPMLMLRGISGRFMFFTAETARAGAADRPPCPNTTTRKNNF